MKSSIYKYIEIIIATLLYIALGIIFHPQDPLFIESKIPLLTLFLIFPTLFYGLRYGGISLILFIVVFYFYYQDRSIELALSYLLYVIILGQFFHYWHLKYQNKEESFRYLNNRLHQLNNRFYKLKISHDQLEKSYAVKPYSLRNAFEELQKLSINKQYDQFLKLIYQNFSVKGAQIALNDKKLHFKTVASNGSHKEVDLKNPLINRTLEKQETSYISKEHIDDNDYLVVIPAKDEYENILALLVIDDLPFMEYNLNTIISIAVSFSYFINTIHKEKRSSSFRSDFHYEYNTLQNLYYQYNINSTMLVIKTKDELTIQQIKDNIDKSIRAIDKVIYSQQNSYFIVAMLLPLTTKSSSEQILNKLINNGNLNIDKFKYMSFSMDESSNSYSFIQEV